MTDNSKTGSPAESLPTTDENRTAPQPQVTRRGLLRAFGVVTGAMAMSGAHAFALEPEWLDDPEFKAGIPSLDANLEGLKIAQVSDLHLRSIGNLHDSILASIKRKNPDLVLLTGDILDSKAHLKQTVEFLRGLAAPGREIIACLGNWEHWGRIKPQEVRKAYEAAGVRLLVDERAMTSHGISVYGSDDGLHANDRASLVQKAVIGKNQGILITHSPFILDRFPTDGRKYGLALSGHTHGGQVYAGPLTFWLPPGSGRFVKGHYDTPAGPAYVSRGIGTVMINARFMSRPELPYFTLTRA